MVKDKNNKGQIFLGLEKIGNYLEDILNELKDKKYKTIEIVLLAFYTIAIAIIAFVQLPNIAESLQQPKIIVKIMPYVIEKNYIPIEVYNVGNKKATNITISIKSCYMKAYIPYDVGDLFPDQKYGIPFVHKKTINSFLKLECQSASDFNLSGYETEIIPYRHKITQEIYMPSVNKTLDVCGYCYWIINITSNEVRRQEEQSTFSPIQLSFYIKGDDIDFSDLNLEKMNPIKISVFDKKYLDILSGSVS